MRRRYLSAVLAATLAAVASPAFAIKPMAQVEDGYPEPGLVESENTFTLDHKTHPDHGFSQYSMENELEWGVNENFTLRVKGAYFYVDSKDETGLKFDQAGIEAQYYFSNPNTDSIGISVIGSVLSGDNSLATEDFLVIQKDFQKWIVAYNLGVAVNVDNVYKHHSAPGAGRETEVSLINQAGVLYCFTPTFRLGADISVESIWQEARIYDHTSAYVGPTLNWIISDKLWITVGAEREIVNSADEPEYRLTVILGYFF